MSIDVRCLPYMPLHIERLRRSKAWLRCKRRPELAFYLMNLWMRAWHEVPAGSIEADDDVLADAAMCSPEDWERIKADVLHGWEQHDGRWHHHVVTELAADGMEKVEASRRRTEAARLARQQNRSASVTSSVTENAAEYVAKYATVSKEKKKGREDRSDADASDAGASAPSDDGWPKDYRERFWSAYPNKVGKAKVFPLLERIRKSRRVTFEKLMSGLDTYKASKPPDRQWCNPETWLNQGRWDDEPSIAAPTRSFEPDREPTRSERGRAAMAQVLAGRDDSRLSSASAQPSGSDGGAADIRGGGVLQLGDAPWPGVHR